MRNARSNRPSSLSPEEFDSIRTLVESQLGVVLPPEKRPMVQARISRRCRELGLQRAEDYCTYLFGPGMDAGETTHLLDAVTTNFTYFYREPPQLEVLEADFLPPMVREASKARRPLRAWSAACSTGEEAWTLAMMIEEAYSNAGAPHSAQIFASDVSTRVLQTAIRAVYRDEDIEVLREDWRERYFLRSKDRSEKLVRVTPALRGHVSFRHLNLMAESYAIPRELDMVFLRNCLIYFDAPTRRQVVARVAQHLKPGGLLVFGASESVSGFGLPLSHVQRSIYRKVG